MTRVYLIRHAEAEGNLYRRVHGHYDSLVTDMGLLQIQALRQRFTGVPVDVVYSSDLVRARSTARALSVPRNIEVITDPRLREVYMGRWEDLTWAQVAREEPEQLRFFTVDPGRWATGTNERLSDQRERIVSAVLDIAARHDGQEVAIVSHGSIIRTLLAYILDLPSERFMEVAHCENTGVTELEVEGGHMRIRSMNDASHLSPQISTFARQSWWKEKSGTDGMNLDFRPIDLRRDRVRYLDYRQDAWMVVHGTMEGYTDEYIDLAAKYAAAHPRAVVEAWLDDKPAGMLELAVNRGAAAGDGAIAFFYLRPEFRGRGLAAQLIGHAVSVYRPLGRQRLTLNVAEVNRPAIRFYQRYGFARTGITDGALGRLWMMEKNIEVRVL